jgi:FAD-dependent oxidoreductase domain-containing protein 1
MSERRGSTDILIVGGGIMGSSLAYWLKRGDPACQVTVIERDPTYAEASSVLSAASIRQQFTTELNIRLSQRSLEFLRTATDHLAIGDERPEIGLKEAGYLYLAGPAEQAALEFAHRIQRTADAPVALLTSPELKARFPWLDVRDLSGGSFGLEGEGWFDGQGLLTAFARKARALGATFVRGEVVGVTVEAGTVRAVTLSDGRTLAGEIIVNAAGPWAAHVARLAGIVLPVSARRRTVFVLSCKTSLPGFPLLIDRSGFWIRPEGDRYIAGVPPIDDRDGLPLEPEYEAFESVLWPALAARVPAFEATRLERAWAGYYDMNDFDHNAIVGPHPDVSNLWFMTGFSGHGMQHAAAVGDLLAGRLLNGRYESLDLTPLAFERVLANQPIREHNIIG